MSSRWWQVDRALAVASWVVLTPCGVLLVRALDLDPFTVQGAVLPLALGAVVGSVLIAVACWRRSDLLCGVAAGAYAAWLSLVMSAALHGTPFGYGRMTGDHGRFTAMATRFTTTSESVDGVVRGLPTEYPPLYPWIVGHVARVVDRPAWTLMSHAQVLAVSASVILAYLLWRRLTTAPVSLAIAALGPAVLTDPSKDYELLALVVLVPWAISSFTDLPRSAGGLHWLPAGLIGGLMVLTYQGFLLYSAVGLLAVMAFTLRERGRRRAMLLHLLGVALTSAVVASWFVLPYVVTLIRDGGQRTSDLFLSQAIVGNPLTLTFLEPTPIGLLQLVGLAGLLLLYRTTTWARPMLLLLAGTYAYQVFYLVSLVQTGHTGFLHYTVRVVAMLLATAGVLTVFEVAPVVARRLRAQAPPAFRVATVALLLVVTGVIAWEEWTPSPKGLRNVVTVVGEPNLATYAHSEPRPNGRTPPYAPGDLAPVPWFPVSAIEESVEATLGTDARPVVLTYDQRLFSYLPWHGYISVNRLSANTLQRWDDRFAQVEQLALVRDPAAFERASRRTTYGAIDVFVLRLAGDDVWTWNGVGFSPDQFSPTAFTVDAGLPEKTVVVVRRPG